MKQLCSLVFNLCTTTVVTCSMYRTYLCMQLWSRILAKAECTTSLHEGLPTRDCVITSVCNETEINGCTLPLCHCVSETCLEDDTVTCTKMGGSCVGQT